MRDPASVLELRQPEGFPRVLLVEGHHPLSVREHAEPSPLRPCDRRDHHANPAVHLRDPIPEQRLDVERLSLGREEAVAQPRQHNIHLAPGRGNLVRHVLQSHHRGSAKLLCQPHVPRVRDYLELPCHAVLSRHCRVLEPAVARRERHLAASTRLAPTRPGASRGRAQRHRLRGPGAPCPWPQLHSREPEPDRIVRWNVWDAWASDAPQRHCRSAVCIVRRLSRIAVRLRNTAEVIVGLGCRHVVAEGVREDLELGRLAHEAGVLRRLEDGQPRWTLDHEQTVVRDRAAGDEHDLQPCCRTGHIGPGRDLSLRQCRHSHTNRRCRARVDLGIVARERGDATLSGQARERLRPDGVQLEHHRRSSKHLVAIAHAQDHCRPEPTTPKSSHFEL
eukprot:648821-Rhodomonas_salina.2